MAKRIDLAWSGDVDLANITPVRRALDEALDDPEVDHVVIDLDAVTFVDSLGLGMLIYARNTGDERGIAVSLRHVPGPTRELLEITGLAPLLPIEPD